MNFADGWHWFRVSRRTPANAISGMMVKGVTQISSIIGGNLLSWSSLSSMQHIKTLVSRGPRGDPMKKLTIVELENSSRKIRALIG